MMQLEDLAERVDRLLHRYQELQRDRALQRQQLLEATAERDDLRVRLAVARARIDLLLARLPARLSADGDGRNGGTT